MANTKEIDQRIIKAQEYLKSTSEFLQDDKILHPDITAIGGDAKNLIRVIKITGCINVDDLPKLWKILKGIED